jgi:hypothetical protein
MAGSNFMLQAPVIQIRSDDTYSLLKTKCTNYYNTITTLSDI